MFYQKEFLLTYVYGYNQDHLRKQLWDDLVSMALNNLEAWGVLGDFNAVLSESDRIGRNVAVDNEIEEYADCIEACEL